MATRTFTLTMEIDQWEVDSIVKSFGDSALISSESDMVKEILEWRLNRFQIKEPRPPYRVIALEEKLPEGITP